MGLRWRRAVAVGVGVAVGVRGVGLLHRSTPLEHGLRLVPHRQYEP